ncbi:MAG: TetR family transcriptional regulator C-terminal domain-containing protein [Clostridia bacterium]|nr:TetR family transcriptional regulator C-terminal domain-containing protein [Clostridia bacterium]
MGNIRQSSKHLKLCLEEALYSLLETKPFNEIDVKLLCKTAYVGRTSFYRYFNGPEDVVLFSFLHLWEDWCDAHNVKERKKFTLDNANTFFEYNYSIRNKLNLVYKNGLESVLLKSFENIMTESTSHNYEARFYGYGLFSMLKEWWLRDFKESPEQLAALIETIVKNGNLLN